MKFLLAANSGELLQMLSLIQPAHQLLNNPDMLSAIRCDKYNNYPYFRLARKTYCRGQGIAMTNASHGCFSDVMVLLFQRHKGFGYDIVLAIIS